MKLSKTDEDLLRIVKGCIENSDSNQEVISAYAAESARMDLAARFRDVGMSGSVVQMRCHTHCSWSHGRSL